MFLSIQPGRKVSSYATELNCIITTCRVNQSVYNNRKIQAILHDNSDLSDVSFWIQSKAKLGVLFLIINHRPCSYSLTCSILTHKESIRIYLLKIERLQKVDRILGSSCLALERTWLVASEVRISHVSVSFSRMSRKKSLLWKSTFNFFCLICERD